MGKVVFIATPIAGFNSENDYYHFRSKLKLIIRGIAKNESIDEIISEILNVPNINNYESPYLSAEKDFNNIKGASHFVLIYPQKIATSALVELGFAIALKKRILILTINQDTLPYMIQELDKVYSNVKITFINPDLSNVEKAVIEFARETK